MKKDSDKFSKIKVGMIKIYLDLQELEERFNALDCSSKRSTAGAG